MEHTELQRKICLGHRPQVKLNPVLLQRYDTGGYLEPGMLARIVAFSPAREWDGGLIEIVFDFSEFLHHNRSLSLGGTPVATTEKLLILPTDPLDFFECEGARPLA